jgi:hypothetical protein
MRTHFSPHSRKRMAQRGLCQETIQLVLKYGRVIHKQGLKFLYITKRMAQDDPELAQATDLMVVVSGVSGVVLTCYRSPKAIRRVKKKPKRLATYALTQSINKVNVGVAA